MFRAARGLVRWLPLPVAGAIGHAFGWLVWTCVPWIRRQTLANLEIAYGAELPEAERRRIGRRVFSLAGRGMFSWIVFHRIGAERALRHIHGELSDDAKAAFGGGGAILLTQHSGLFELASSWCAKNLGVWAVGRDGEGDPGTSMLIAMRAEMGARTIEHGSAREIVRKLKEGGIVGMLADQDIRRVNGAFVPFFGRLAHTPLGPATFAVRMGVPVVAAVTEWRSATEHAFVATEVLHPRTDLPHEEAVLELTARCTEAIERAVRRRPSEWLWMHDRWRTSPADRPEAPVWPPERRAEAEAIRRAASAAAPAGAGAGGEAAGDAGGRGADDADPRTADGGGRG